MPTVGRTMLALSLLATIAPGVVMADPDEDERFTLRAEGGVEYDSNPRRLEIIAGAPPPPIAGSGLERLVLTGSLFDVIAAGQTISLGATAAGKLFDSADARTENVAIAQSSAAWRLSLGERAHLVASGAYYEAFQATSSDPVRDAERRDFRSLSPFLQLGGTLGGSLDATVGAGWRFLVWKPDRDFDFAGPTAALDLRWSGLSTPEADWELGTGGGFEHRRFGGPALALQSDCSPPGLPCPTTTTRVDDFFTARADITRVGRVLVGAGYALHYNRSNSYGETVWRHFATLRLAIPMPFEATVAARGEILYATYHESVPITAVAGNQFVGIDYESRSSAQIDLSRPLGPFVRLAARWTAYFNELGSSSGSYRRQTILLSLIVGLEK